MKIAGNARKSLKTKFGDAWTEPNEQQLDDKKSGSDNAPGQLAKEAGLKDDVSDGSIDEIEV